MTEHSTAKNESAPWEIKRSPSAKRLVGKLIPWLIGVFLLLLLLWGLSPKPIVIETGVAARKPLTVQISEEGKTRVKNRYVVAAPVSGKMRRVLLKPGDQVTAGETILTSIDPAPSSLLDPRSRAQAEAVVSLHKASRQQAAELLEARRAALKMADADRDRVRSLTRAGSLSDSERDRMEAEASMKAAEVRAAEFSLQVIDYEIIQAEAALAQPESNSSNSLVDVKSPVSGRVLKVIQESEMIITPGAPILEIGDPGDIEIEAEILSRDAVAIKAGDPVEVEQWGGAFPIKGIVRRVEPAAFTKISALGVEEQRVIVLIDLIDIPEAAKSLGDRYRVEVRVATWHANDALVIPAGSLFREGNLWKTYVFKNDTAKLTTVEAGQSDGRFTEILSGIQAGEEVLLHPPDTVKDGAAVTRRSR